MKEIDWLMLVPMGFMGSWITIMIRIIIVGIKENE